jgi:hypothetical protein
MMNYETLRVDIADRIAKVTLNQGKYKPGLQGHEGVKK